MLYLCTWHCHNLSSKSLKIDAFAYALVIVSQVPAERCFKEPINLCGPKCVDVRTPPWQWNILSKVVQAHYDSFWSPIMQQSWSVHGPLINLKLPILSNVNGIIPLWAQTTNVSSWTCHLVWAHDCTEELTVKYPVFIDIHLSFKLLRPVSWFMTNMT